MDVEDEQVPERCDILDKFLEFGKVRDLRADRPPREGNTSRTLRPEDSVFLNGLEEDVLDDLTGEWLFVDIVMQAKVEELTDMYRRGVWAAATRTVGTFRIGATPIIVRWGCN